VGDARQATSTINRTLNPEWNQTFELPVVDIHCVMVEGTCWDKDRFGKDYMGEFDLMLEDIFCNGQSVQEVSWRNSRHKLHADFQ
jgi:phosphatidylserine decarboxylase